MTLKPSEKLVEQAIKEHGKGTSISIGEALGMDRKLVSRTFCTLENLGLIHLSGYTVGKNKSHLKVYTYGEGVSQKKMSATQRQDEARRKFAQRNSFDPFLEIVQNAGWTSRIHSLDHSMQHGDHIRYMQRFKPYPDPAAAWLFHEPKVELQGARHDGQF